MGDKLLYLNDVLCGTFSRDVDGYWKFYPEHKPGSYWDESMLLQVAYFLRRENIAFNLCLLSDPAVGKGEFISDSYLVDAEGPDAE